MVSTLWSSDLMVSTLWSSKKRSDGCLERNLMVVREKILWLSRKDLMVVRKKSYGCPKKDLMVVRENILWLSEKRSYGCPEKRSCGCPEKILWSSGKKDLMVVREKILWLSGKDLMVGWKKSYHKIYHLMIVRTYDWDVDDCPTVSYTHLTLPTILRV